MTFVPSQKVASGLSFEGDGQSVIGDRPALGQFRHDGVVIVGHLAGGQLLGAEADQPVIAVDRDLVARAVGADAMQIEAVDGLAEDGDERVTLLRLGGQDAQEGQDAGAGG